MIKFKEVNAVQRIADKRKSNNILLSKNVKVSLDPKISKAMNNNVLVIGGSGTGKGFNFAKPNIEAAHSNYVITDPSGDYYNLYSEQLREKGYEIKVLNLNDLTSKDELNLNDFYSNKKTALFIIPNFLDNSKNFLINILLTQIVDILSVNKSVKYNHTQFILDEFDNIGYVCGIETILNAAKMYNFSVSILIQNISQLKTKYKNNWQEIIGLFSNLLFLGTTNNETAEFMSEIIGKEPCNEKTGIFMYKKLYKYIMSPEEIIMLPIDSCIVLINRLEPIVDEKYRMDKVK